VLKKEIKTILSSKSKPVSRYQKLEYEAIKEANKEIRKELRKAKREGDRAKYVELIKDLDTDTENELRNEINKTVEFSYRNTSISVKRDYLSKLKDPEKYVNKMYLNKTYKQIEKLTKEGRESEALGLVKLAEKSVNKLKTDKAKVKSYSNKLNKAKKNLKEKLSAPEEEDEEEETSYNAIFSTSGSIIDITLI